MGFRKTNKKVEEVKEEVVIAEATMTTEIKEDVETEFSKEDINVMVDFIYERMPESVKGNEFCHRKYVKEFIDNLNLNN